MSRECRPPPKYDHHPWHWVEVQDPLQIEPMYWSTECWYQTVDPEPVDPEDAAELGWRWVSIAMPPTHNPPTEEQRR